MNRGCLGCVPWLLLVVVTIVVAVKTPTTWLPLIGEALDVPADLHPVDVIIVLGGGDGDRDRYASVLFTDGLAKEIIATGAPVGTDVKSLDLIAFGVPRDAIVLANGTQNTRDDAMRSRQLMEQRGWTTALLVTDPYHARRSLWTFRAAFDSTNLSVAAAPVVGGSFDAAHWWQNEEGFTAVVGEYLKLAYYVARGYITPASIL